MQFLALKRYGLAFAPNVVILIAYLANDVSDTCISYLDHGDEPGERNVRYPYYVLDGGNLKPVWARTSRLRGLEPGSILKFPHRRSYTYYALLRGMKSTSLGRIILGHLHPKALDADRVDPIPVRVRPNPQDKAFVGRNLFEGSEGMCWQATTDLMVKMKEEIAMTEAEFLVALLPASEQAIVDRLREHVKNVGLGETLTEAELNAPEKQVARRLAEAGVAAVVLGPRMRQFSEKPWLLYFLRDAHLSEAGHKVVARILHEELSSRGWLAEGSPE